MTGEYDVLRELWQMHADAILSALDAAGLEVREKLSEDYVMVRLPPGYSYMLVKTGVDSAMIAKAQE